MSSAPQRLTPDQAVAFHEQIAVELIGAKHAKAVEAFECHPEIDKFLKKDALQACIDGLSRPWLFLHEGNIAGYVTLSASTVRLHPDERAKLKIMDRTEWPALLIGYLGVDKRYRGGGRGLGDKLIEFAVGQAQVVADLAAVKFVVADVNQEAPAVAMYERNGFVRGAHKLNTGATPRYWLVLPSKPGD
jgi:ribosomal protein S18 acetylase RimI-like enzyme